MKSKKHRKLNETEIEIVRQVIEEKFGSTSRGNYIISYSPNYLDKGRTLYPRPAKQLYEALEKDERVAFLQEIIDLKECPKTSSPEDAIREGYKKLFEEILGTIVERHQEALENYLKRQTTEYQSASLEKRKQIIGELEQTLQGSFSLTSGNSSH